MLQDIAPHIYRNQMSWKAPDADDFVLCYRGRTLYCKVENRNLILPRVKDVAAVEFGKKAKEQRVCKRPRLRFIKPQVLHA